MSRLYASTFPVVTCPHCNLESRWDDYYDLKWGDEWECDKCGETIYVLSVEHEMTAIVSTKLEGEVGT